MPILSNFHVLAAFALVVAACAPSKSYYRLTSEGPAPSGGGPGVGVGPVAVAAYIDRPNLVFQQSDNRLAIAESHRWAGDLEQNIASVLANNLGRRLGTGNVRTYPWSEDGDLRHQISIDIRQLHGTTDGDAFIEAAWRVYSLPDRRMSASRSWSGTEPLAADGYDALAAAQSRLLVRLAAEIAASL